MLLQVNPKKRPDATKLLALPSIIKRMNDKHLQEIENEDLVPEMLNTIRIPKNLKFLSETLPKPNYEPMKLRMVDKGKFLKTLQTNTPNTFASSFKNK